MEASHPPRGVSWRSIVRFVIWSVFALLLAGVALAVAAAPQPLFTPEERARIVAYWNEPGRYTVQAPPKAVTDGPWQVRQTPEGSVWLLNYTRKVSGSVKISPSEDAKGDTPETRAWEAWLNARMAYERRMAENAVARANAQALGRPAPIAADAPPMPGVIPDSLVAAVGNPPPFYTPAAPVQATVTFPDGETLAYESHVPVRDRFAYYRQPEGTVSYGVALSRLPAEELDKVFAIGMSPGEGRAARAVSLMEGGFDSVNTYDTGYVSVGFIQFITGEEGNGSLAAVLRREKTDAPAAFELDFRQYGLDVSDAGVVAVDPDTGAELTGREAVRAIIRDRRLTAPFQRAGRHSNAFRAAQIQVARDRYWPANDPITIAANGNTLTGKVSDVVRSEAGLATLFDRKVNRGNIRPLEDVVAKLMADRKLKTLDEARAHERDIVAALKYRRDFLADPTLGQPAPPPTR